jgi:23S rRNA C2498 (ribose-2'-O)-methylase RlmM
VQGAIDLGAAPGAWTELLAARAQHVVAVDTAELSAQCAALPNVRHVHKTSESVAEIRGAINMHAVDLITCDMNQPPRFCSECIAPLLNLLRPGGWVVMTVKLYGLGRDRCELTPAYLQTCCAHLPAAPMCLLATLHCTSWCQNGKCL